MGPAYQLAEVDLAVGEVESATCLEDVHQDADLVPWQLQASVAVALVVEGEEPFSEDPWDQ